MVYFIESTCEKRVFVYIF